MNSWRENHSAEFHRLSRSAFLLVILSALAVGPGCQLFTSSGAPRTDVPKGIVANQNQMRLRMRALVQPMCGEIEKSADAIIAGTTNRAVQLAALRWKIEGVPALRAALFQPEPFTAGSDTWVLCFQMADYFEKGPGRQSLGEASSQAAATCRRMEEDFTRIIASASVSGDVSELRELVRTWAAEHPIQHSIAARESTLSRALEQNIAGAFSIGRAVTDVTVTTDDLNRKLEVYSNQLFKQARWEAELFKLELMEDLPAEHTLKSVEEALANVTRLATAAEGVLAVAENAPAIVASERETAIKALQDEFMCTTKFFHEERVAALEQLDRERVAALADFHKALIEERKAMASDIEQISLRSVDYAMWRVTQLVAIAGAVIFVAVTALLFLVRRIFFHQPLEVGRR